MIKVATIYQMGINKEMLESEKRVKKIQKILAYRRQDLQQSWKVTVLVRQSQATDKEMQNSSKCFKY